MSTVTLNNIQWREDLPDGCPPADATPAPTTVLLRLVPSKKVVDDDFRSHMALGYPPPKVGDLASWASCSMFLTSYESHRLKGLTKFPRLKHMSCVAYIEVDETSGCARISPSKHVDVWMYSNYSPASSVANVVDLNAYQPN